MPRIPTETTNGAPTPRPSAVPGWKRGALGHRLRELMQQSHVRIGSPIYTPGDEDDTASWADLAEQIAGIRWLVRPWVPYQMITGLIAEPKVGKSAFALWALVRPVITGCSWFTGIPGPEPGFALWADTERRAAINMDRAAKWGIPIERIKTPFADDPKRPIDLDNAEHRDRIFSVICKHQIRLSVIDSLRGAHSGSENDSRIGATLQGIAEIAEQTGTAVVVIHHTKKLVEDQEPNANSGRGSNAFLATIANQIVIDRPVPKGEWRRVQVLGDNLGSKPDPLGFAISDTGLTFGSAPEKPRQTSSKDEAEAWLRSRMKTGETYLAAELLAEAEQYGHSLRTMQRAATERLGIKPEAIRDGGKFKGWKWRLP